jgi:hypothetical protein
MHTGKQLTLPLLSVHSFVVDRLAHVLQADNLHLGALELCGRLLEHPPQPEHVLTYLKYNWVMPLTLPSVPPGAIAPPHIHADVLA